MIDFEHAAKGETQPHDDTTDQLYALREFLSNSAFQDCQRHYSVFSEQSLYVSDLIDFDRFLQQSIETDSGIEILAPEEIGLILVRISQFGAIYSNLFVENSGQEDAGDAPRLSKILENLNTIEGHFIRMSLQSNVSRTIEVCNHDKR